MMIQSYGKLTLIQQDGPEQEYDLGKTNISIGRAMTNDIILSDARVSRSHARLECGPSGSTVIDLGSANGIRLNGARIDRAKLVPGDIIGLGNTQLRFDITRPLEEAGATVIDTEADLNLSLDQEFLPVAINETSTPRLLVFTKDGTRELSLEDADQVTIGRVDENDLVIEQEKVSRRHAEVVRKGSLFILRDLGSSNGTWVNDEKISELVLQDGDMFRIGQGQVIFKSGFSVESLTMADESISLMPERRPVVFVPGMMGSELWLGNERIWPNIKLLFKNPNIFRYPSSIPLEPRGIVDQVVIIPNLIKLDQYNRLGDYLVEDLGYERGKDFFEFGYDFRQDVRISSQQLSKFIENLPTPRQVTIIAHSLGTMVSRYYIEYYGGKKRVERIMLMGGPHQGSPKILTSMLIAPDILPFGIMGERMRQTLSTFPSVYQIIPDYPCGVDQNGMQINFLDDESWLSEPYRSPLRAGKQFRRELGRRISVPAISIYGYGIKTTSAILLNRSKTGELSNISYKSELNGDSTILERSAVLEGTEIHPVQQYHGSLFVDNDVKMRLKMELSRQFSA
jgi:pSer/pThr/pTyr-binding forkhead associated (FHA) protein